MHDSHFSVPAATQLKSAGQREAALVKYQQAVDICPSYADGFYDLGVYYSEDSQVGLLASLNVQSRAALHFHNVMDVIICSTVTVVMPVACQPITGLCLVTPFCRPCLCY